LGEDVSSTRLLDRALVSTLASALLLAGPMAVAPASAAPVAAAQVGCKTATQNVAKARTALAQARRAKVNRAARVVRATRVLKQRRARKAVVCRLAAQQSAMITRTGAVLAKLQTIRSGTGVASLPGQLRDPLSADLGAAIARVAALQAQAARVGLTKLQLVPGELTPYVPTDLAWAVNGMNHALSATGHPAGMAALMEGLYLLPVDVTVPAGDLAKLKAAYGRARDHLLSYDAVDGHPYVENLAYWLGDAAYEADNLAWDLGETITMVAQLNGDVVPTDPAAYASLFAAVLSNGQLGELPFPMPTDADTMANLVALCEMIAFDIGGSYTGPDMVLMLTRLGASPDVLLLLGEVL
jgi:hypothetical protein